MKTKKKTTSKKTAPKTSKTITEKTTKPHLLTEELLKALEENTKVLNEGNRVISNFTRAISKLQITAPANDTSAEKKLNTPTVEEVRGKLIELKEKFDRGIPVKLLKKFKVNKIPDLKESDYPEVIRLAEQKLMGVSR